TAMPGRLISRTPRATRSRCSAIRRGMCRSLSASRSISTSRRTSSTARPRLIAATATVSSPSRNGAPRSARRSRRSSTPNASTSRRDEMTETKGYHAHVYYDAATKPKAARLREAIIGKFKVEPGAFSDEPRGPHPISQFNVIFETPEFQNLVPWLMLNREGLDVLVHPLTDSSYNDHTAPAMWSGAPVALKADTLRHAAVGDGLV